MNLKYEIKICLIGLFCFCFCFKKAFAAENNYRVLIINSDSSVDKYLTAQQEFEKNISYPVLPVCLNDKKWDITAIESLISEKKPNVIYCIGTKAYLITSQYDPGNNIVFSSIINWLRLPLTEKTYGISNELPTEMEIMLFRYIFTDIKKIGILYSKEYNGEWFEKTKNEVKEAGIKITGENVSDSKDTILKLKNLLADINAFRLISDPVVMSDKETVLNILKMCDDKKIPVFAYNQLFIKYGAILVISADDSTIGRQASGIVTDVIKKVKIAEKVKFPAGTHIILNLKKVKEYGLKYSKDALSSVNEIIE